MNDWKMWRNKKNWIDDDDSYNKADTEKFYSHENKKSTDAIIV